MQVSNVDKNIVKQKIYKECSNHPLGLTLSTPGKVLSIFSIFFVLDSRIDVERKYLDFENRDLVVLARLSPDTKSQII